MPGFVFAEYQREKLSRGVVAVSHADGGHFVGWRLLGSDEETVGFNVYLQPLEGAAVKLNDAPIFGATNFVVGKDRAKEGARYFVKAVSGGKESGASKAAPVWEEGYLEIPVKAIEGYRPGDASVGDLDGDGEYELVVHMGGRAHDNSHSGLTDNAIIDAYEFDGTHLWRIDLGKNIRDGEHYTQFMVYDLDGDGRAEVACRTADGSKDGQGTVIGDETKDWRDLDRNSKSYGRILKGPEFLTIFDGASGEALKTVDYEPGRDPVNGWGGIGGNSGNDSYGNRCDRFLACVAYLDGERPSLVMCRGVYGRTVLVAWDWRDGEFSRRWTFDSGISYPPFRDASPYSGMGGHSVSVADVDADGRDEIVYQAMVVDDDGKGLHTSGLRHGDAMHVSDFDPSRPGLEVFTVQENERGPYAARTPGAALRDARTGEILWSHSNGVDVRIGMAADIDPRYPGAEMWGGPGGLRTAAGEQIGPAPRTSGFGIWWDGDLLRELLSSTWITKWNPEDGREKIIKQLRERGWRRGRYPALVADLTGDWREEVIVASPDNRSLRLFSTPVPTEHRLLTLMHDRQYRLSVAWQNVVYNKPPHTSFFLGEGMRKGKSFDFKKDSYGKYDSATEAGWEGDSRGFSVKVPEGNHRVTVTLGNPDKDVKVTVKAELRRLMVEDLPVKAGETREVSFVVNTRTPAYGDGKEVRLKDRERREEALAWDDKLTLEFIESAPAVQSVSVEPAPELPTVFVLGDSTVCDQPNEPYASWGQMLTRFFSDEAGVANHGESGESYGASLSRGRINKIVDVMRPGDYLILQFGHNDMKERGEGKGAFLNYTDNMRKHVAMAREKGGIPLLVTPVHRRRFDENGKVVHTFGDYTEAVRRVAAEEKVPLLDLQARSAELYEALGPEDSGLLFKKGDGTHHNNYGAYLLAKCVIEEIREKVPGVAKWIREDMEPFDPGKPDPIEEFRVPASASKEGEKPDGD